MSLLSLQDDPHLLLDGPQGVIRYVSECVPARDADEWLAELMQTVPWAAERRLMYEREVDVPRLTAHFDLDAGNAAAPKPIVRMHAIACTVAAAQFDSVGLNLYRDGNDSVAPHNDKLHQLKAGEPIALFSLGATRRMTIRSKNLPRRTLQLELESGSLLVMSYATQLHFDHGIAKTRTPVGPRVSLAFRCRPRAGA